MGVKLFLRGPMDEFHLPLNAEATESVRFVRKTPGVAPQEIAQEVSDEVAMELLTRPRRLTKANFQCLDPADEERLFPGKRAVDNEGVPASQQLLANVAETPQTTLPANAPAVEKDAEAPRKK
jgi:hypothetical protein